MSKPTIQLVSHAATSSSTAQSPIASKSLGKLKASCHPDWKSTGKLGARKDNQDAASSSQVWQKDAEMDKSTRRLVAAEKDQELQNAHENLKSTRKLVASGISDIDGNGTMWPHNLPISTASVSHLGKVLSNVRPIRSQIGRENERCQCKYDFMVSVTLQAAVHLGNDYAENLHSIINQPKRTLKQLVNVTEKLIRDQKEISGIPGIYWQLLM